jgi:hypothetical protein
VGIYIRLINHDEVFERGDIDTTIVNDIENITESQRESNNQTLFTTNGDVYNNVPTCSCGALKGKHKLGEYCKNCNTTVKETVGERLTSYVFIRCPDGVSKLINPKVWMLLRGKLQFAKGKFDLVKYLTDPHYEPEIKTSDNINSVLGKLEEANLNVRSYNHFVDNFFTYMDFLFELREFKGRVKGPKPDLYHVIMNSKDKIFSNYIPILNKSLLVVEKTNVGSYIDQQMIMMIDAIRLMIGIDVEPTVTDDNDRKKKIRLSNKQARVSRCLSLLSDFYYDIYRNFFSPKKALLRRHIGGTRVDYSFRTVISSNSDIHHYDEIHIPWSVATSVFRLHITNKLMKKGWSPHEIMHYLIKYSLEYHELLDEIFQELINEAKVGDRIGIPCFCNRNPSLLRGSNMRCRITKVKTDVNDATTSISVLITGNPNADFDGDEMNFMLLLDNYIDHRGHTMAPEMNAYNLDSVNKPSSVLNLTKPVASIVQNWLSDIGEPEPEIMELMKEFQ